MNTVHRTASAALAKLAHDRSLKPLNLFNFDTQWDQHLGSLQPPVQDGFTVKISFYAVKDRPDLVRVQSSNWRCEDEPNDVYTREDARKIWRACTAAGMVGV